MTSTVWHVLRDGPARGRVADGDHVIETVALGGGLSVVYWMAGPRVLDWRLADTDVESGWHIHPVDLRPARTEEPTIPVLPDHAFRDGHVPLPVGADARPRASTN